MAIEILPVPEELLPDVVAIIRQGLAIGPISSGRSADLLAAWCSSEEIYLKEMSNVAK